MEEDRSALFNQLKNFSQRKLKKVETKVVTGSGEQLVEKRGAKGLQVLSGLDGSKGGDQAEPTRKLDLQVGLVLPGFLIASQDVAHDKSNLESYGVTHILNLAPEEVENKFEDDYNYKSVYIKDEPNFELEAKFVDLFEFIDDGRHYGNVLIHCAGVTGLSRSTATCIAYLMNKENQKFDEAFNNVKEARSFVRPNEGFVKQLKEYEVKLRGAQQVKESGIDDPFALRKKQEIEQEKALVAGVSSVKNRMKMFGQNLEANNQAPRSKSVSPMPSGNQSSNSSTASKWAPVGSSVSKDIKKSSTPEPRKSWQASKEETSGSNSWKSSATINKSPLPPPPPPPMPASNLHGGEESQFSLSSRSSIKNQSSLPPPPPPPPPPMPAGESPIASIKQTTSSVNSQQESQRKVFGKIPPPPMKIKNGLSVERQDTIGDRNTTTSDNRSKAVSSSLKLPLKKQITSDLGGESEVFENSRAPSPSAALRAAKQQAASANQSESQKVSDQPRQSVCGQLNRSSTKKLLNLIKTKTKSDLTLSDGDENDEIEALLGALGNEAVENIDWDELGLDEDEVKDIIERGADESSSSSSESEDEEDDDDVEQEEVEKSTQHFVIRTK